MKKKLLILALIPLLIISGCAKDSSEEAIPSIEFYDFSFLKNNNPALSADIKFRTIDQKISGTLPFNIELNQLVATFEHNGNLVSVNNQTQESGKTVIDFTQVVTYTVTGSNGQTENFEVDIRRFTGLPIFFISTEGGAEIESKDDYLNGNVSLYGGRLYDDLEGEMKIRGRGNSTWFIHPKKPYQLKFDDKTEVMEMPADKKWIFLAEYSDKTLLRNKVAFEMGYLSDLDWTASSAFAEVFVNDKYNGTYHISQKVEESVNRVDLGDNGYLLEIDQEERLDPDDVYFNTDHFLINIKEPELSFGSGEFNLIRNFIKQFETALFGNDFTNPQTGYEKYIDVASFVDWYLISEITKNQDSRSYSSIFMNYVPGEKLKMGPLWDFDLAFGNVNYSECEFPEGFWVKHHDWFDRLFQDPKFVNQVKERFAYFKSKEAAILKLIDENATYLQWAQAENDQKWDLIGNWVWPNSVVLDSYEAEVDHLKSWFTTRMAWLDKAYKEL